MDEMDQKPDAFPSSFLLCKVCDSLLAEPISLPCGHTCCRTCLVKELRKAKECPSCRATCHTRKLDSVAGKRKLISETGGMHFAVEPGRRSFLPDFRRSLCEDINVIFSITSTSNVNNNNNNNNNNRAEDQPQNVMISQIAKTMFPELMERRLRETEAEKAKFELCLPAFFYNVPVFPGQTLCLHFFEPRYKLMMRRIIDTSRRFAYVLPALAGRGDWSGSPRSHTALVAHVCEAEFLSDGRVMVKTKLVGRYTIQDDLVEDGTGGLHYCQLEPFEDDPLEEGTSEGRELKDLHAQATALCDGFLGPFKGQLVQAHGEMPADAVGLSMWMASFLPFYAPEKFALVRSRCTRRRLRACLQCAASMEALARASARREEKTSVGDTAADSQSPTSSSVSLSALPPSPPPSQPPAEAAAEAVAVAVAQAGPRGAQAPAATASAPPAPAAEAAQEAARGVQSSAQAVGSDEQVPSPMATPAPAAAAAAAAVPSSPAVTESSDDRWRPVPTEAGASQRARAGWESR